MNRIAKVAVGMAAASTLSLMAATPAEAARVSFQGCTVTNDAPYYAGFDTLGNVPYVYYPLEVTCADDLSIEVEMVRWEQDFAWREGPGLEDEDYLSTSIYNWDFSSGAGTVPYLSQRTLPLTNNEGIDEEIYNQVRFRVTSDTVTGPWTAYAYSPVSAIRH